MNSLFHFITKVTGVKHGGYTGFAIGTPRRRTSVPFSQLESFLDDPVLMDGNFYFGCSTMDGRGFQAGNCLEASAILADIDAGREGHNKPSSFETVEEAQAHVESLPIKPSCVWCTGHGLQAAYMLKSRIKYLSVDAEKFHRVKMLLYYALRSDSTSSPASLFRMPGSMNMKPDCLPVRSYFIRQLDDSIRYTLPEMLEALPPVPVRPRAVRSNGTRAQKAALPDVEFGEITSAEDLDIPAGLQEILDANHPEGTRSEAFFKAVLGLYDCGASLGCIREILLRNQSLSEKFDGRLNEEIVRAAAKAKPEQPQFLHLAPPNPVVIIGRDKP